MKLTYDTIYSRCKDISAYEGGRITDANGKSMFSIVCLTDQDKDLVKEYVKQVSVSISELIRFALSWIEFKQDGVEFTYLDDTSLHANKNDVNEAVEAAIVSYVMAKWLGNKSEERKAAWEQIHDEQMRLLPRAFKRKRPSLDTNY